jgi:hypothetical protein
MIHSFRCILLTLLFGCHLHASEQFRFSVTGDQCPTSEQRPDEVPSSTNGGGLPTGCPLLVQQYAERPGDTSSLVNALSQAPTDLAPTDLAKTSPHVKSPQVNASSLAPTDLAKMSPLVNALSEHATLLSNARAEMVQILSHLYSLAKVLSDVDSLYMNQEQRVNE